MYHYHAKVVRVVDGDTLDVGIDLGFAITTRQRLRLARVDTPELNSSDREERIKAINAKDYVFQLCFNHGWLCTVKTEKTGKYGRWLAEVYMGDDKNEQVHLNEVLIEQGWGWKPKKN